MAVTYQAALKTARLQDVADLIASKTIASATGTALAGQLVIGTSALSGATGVLATIALPATAATVSGSVLTLAGVPLSVAASAGGTAALAEFRNNAGTTIVSGLTVGGTAEGTASGKDIVLAASTISSGVTVTITAGTITHA
jgi:hypothetical protein